MPNVLAINGFTFSILLPPREHGPAHVHVVKAGKEVVINLGTLTIREVKGMRRADVADAVDLTYTHHAHLLAQWRKYHG